MDIAIVIPPRIIDDFGYTPAAAALLKGSLNEANFISQVMDLNSEVDERFREHELINAINNFFLFNTFYNKRVWEILAGLFNEWADRILELSPRWVAISVFTYNSQRATRLLAIAIKKKSPETKIVIGGAGIATDFDFPETLKKQKIIDAFIRGEGELAIVELLNGNTVFPGINGIPPAQIKDVDEIPFPDYSDYELKNYTNKKGLEALPITGSRGCVRKCTFCDIASMWPRYYYRSGKNIADEIRFQINKHGVNSFRFTDSLINGSMKAFREMINELSEFRMSLPEHKRFTWDTHFIVRGEKHMKPSDFDIMRDAGAGTLLIGVESGSPAVRDHMKKGFTESDLDYTMEQLHRVGVKTRLLMIVGYPTETKEDFNLTLKMFERYKKYLDSGIIEEVNLGLTLNLLPNTPLWDKKEEYNILQKNDHINDWVCMDNPSLTYKERLRRRIILQARIEDMGYKVFESENYLKQLISSWEEVRSLPENTGTLIKTFNYDAEQNSITAQIIDNEKNYHKIDV